MGGEGDFGSGSVDGDLKGGIDLHDIPRCEMYNLYLSKGDKRTTERILLRNVREDELPALKRVFLNNRWRVVIEMIDDDD